MEIKKGLMLAMEGIDGSGKGTQGKLLAKHLKRKGYKVKYINFPQYDSWSSIFVKKYLNHGLGSVDKVGPYPASIFYALDRYVVGKDIKNWINEGYIVISNRYVASNKGHQAAKIDNKEERQKFLDWLDEVEYEIFSNPKEDIDLFLDVPPKVAQGLVDQKTVREYLSNDKKQDIHEEDIEHLKKARQAYLDVLESNPDKWIKVSCVEEGELLSIEEIHDKIWKVIKERVL